MNMSTPTLHYIHDPLCGWCYGAAPLVRAARQVLPVQAHAGGMMTGAARRPITAELRRFVMAHDQQIAQVTGQVFGKAYVDGLLQDTTALLDSAPPTTAVLAAEQLAQAGLDLLAQLQLAHYRDGRRIADFAVLLDLALAQGLDADTFTAAYRQLQAEATQAHIAESRALLARVGGQGFPTFALETNGQFTRIDIGRFLGQPEAWRNWLNGLEGVAAAGSNNKAPVCGPDGCAL
jgi:putative protein-disulfide isomerase